MGPNQRFQQQIVSPLGRLKGVPIAGWKGFTGAPLWPATSLATWNGSPSRSRQPGLGVAGCQTRKGRQKKHGGVGESVGSFLDNIFKLLVAWLTFLTWMSQSEIVIPTVHWVCRDAPGKLQKLILPHGVADILSLHRKRYRSYTLPKTNIALENGGWETTFLLGRPCFQGLCWL